MKPRLQYNSLFLFTSFCLIIKQTNVNLKNTILNWWFYDHILTSRTKHLKYLELLFLQLINLINKFKHSLNKRKVECELKLSRKLRFISFKIISCIVLGFPKNLMKTIHLQLFFRGATGYFSFERINNDTICFYMYLRHTSLIKSNMIKLNLVTQSNN